MAVAALLALSAGIAGVSVLPSVPAQAQPAPGTCRFVLGFAALRTLVDESGEGSAAGVGECLEDEHFNPANGNAEQRTTGGLLVWRKADNWTAFTDGWRTWIAGPDGLAVRLNTERFTWEDDPPAAAPDDPTPPAQPDQPSPPGLPAPPAHDWRRPGFVAAVGGQLYDGRCQPLRSAGSNVPNLAVRPGLAANLDWMRRHHLRWVRVFATGHNPPVASAPRDAAGAVAALRALLSQVEAENAARSPEEAIYVLISLTDYYPPGVPGDRYAFDHPRFRAAPVLPAPWFRAGTPSFDFDQEHNAGPLTGLPNYEVFYKPWVRRVVAALAGNPVVMGWQLGNELKARHSDRNQITPAQAYAWYLDFTRDMVDTIREVDQNHLVFMGAQHIAELVDWDYRPREAPIPDLIPTYRRLVQEALDACGQSCWNVWSLTAYDFNPYPLDDAATFGEAGVATAMTEYGFTRGTAAEMQLRYGGDRARAIAQGVARPWQRLDGQPEFRQWSVAELMAQLPVAAIAPWASPAPEPFAGMDADGERGITGTPDEAAVWAAWAEVAARLEAANQAAGSSTACLALESRN